MGTDNLFHKRKAQRATDLARRKAKQSAYDKVLIVCEGEKTEPNYLQGLIDHYQLNSANVVIAEHQHTDPLAIVEQARQRYREERDAGDPFDRVYCVFDKDTHTRYQPALEQIASATPKATFFATHSVPCFEYWLLLHFLFTCRPYEPLPGNSPCNQTLHELKGYLPEYTKGARNTFTQLLGQLDFAKHNAERALQAAQANNTDNPTTRMHQLVDYLQRIKTLKQPL